jgi:hypothetical protein
MVSIFRNVILLSSIICLLNKVCPSLNHVAHTHELFVDASAAKAELARREEELAQLKKKHDIGDD